MEVWFSDDYALFKDSNHYFEVSSSDKKLSQFNVPEARRASRLD